ncbi:1258_t:CDS:1, partial [Racocetra persica]
QVKKHGKISEVETLLKKVFGSDGKVKSAFIEEIKKSDATLTNLKSLLQKEPKDIITYIARFTYNQLPDTGEEKNKQKTQMKRRIAKKLNKTKESELKDEELNDSLYKIEIEELTIDNKFYTADLKEITTTQNPENDEQKSSWKA